jgi:uncharacterized membrane-anchored protein YitT (DUF2179 family)
VKEKVKPINRAQAKRWSESIVLRNRLKSLVFMVLGVVCASVGLKGFLLPNGFIDGGAMGISLLVARHTDVPLSALIVAVNAPFVALGIRQFGWQFAVKSALAVVALAGLTFFIEVPVVTQDGLLIAVFGGVFLGAGIGFAIRGGAVIDGTEVLAISISRSTSWSVGDIISGINLMIFASAAMIVSVETAMYSLLTYFAASKTVDFIINGVEEYRGILIVSEHFEAMREHLVQGLGRGVTVFKSDGGFGKRGQMGAERDVLFCVVTRLEISKLMLEIDKVDPQAFVIQYPIKETRGGMIKRRPLVTG